MEGDNVAVLLASSPNVDEVQVVEEGPRVCPLCSSQIKLFFINFNEKLLMCENTECEFPFGYEDLQFVQVDNTDTETGSIKTRRNFFSRSHSRSSISGFSITDVDKLYKACDSEDTSDATSCSVIAQQPNKRPYSRENRRKMEKNVEELKNLNLELVKVNSEIKIQNKTIIDKKLIRKLYNLQDISGVKLLKPEELEKLKREEKGKQPEVKIDISNDDVSVIKIELISSENNSKQSID